MLECMKRNIYIIIASFFLLFFSCTEDKGNYNYKEIDQIEFDTDNLETNYSMVSFKDTLKIKPVFKNIKDNSDLEFLWTIYPEVGDDEESFDMVDTISIVKDLKYAVELPMGNFNIHCKVFDKQYENLMTSMSFRLTVNTEFTEGFYVMKETADGNSDIDLFTSKDKMLENLISKSTGMSMSGKPLSFGLYPTFSYFDNETGSILDNTFLMPISEDDFAMMRIEDMKKVRDFSDMFYNGDPGEKPLFFYPGTYYFGCVTEKSHYHSYQAVAYGLRSAGSYGMSDEISYDDKGYTFHKSSFISNARMTFFDTKNGRFIKCDANAGFAAIDDVLDKFKCNNIEDELVYFGGDKQGNDGYAIFKNNSEEGRIMYYLSDIGSGNPVDTVFNIAPELEINQANLFSVGKNSEKMLYYASGNKIYNYSSITETESELAFEDFPADEEITYLENIFFTASDEEQSFDYLVIGTYKDGSYSIYLYNTLGGKPLGEPVKVLKGEGRAAKIQYLHPELNNAERTNYTQLY